MDETGQCIDEGRLRAYLDAADSGLTDAERADVGAHLGACAVCERHARSLAADAARAYALLAAWAPTLGEAPEAKSRRAGAAFARFQAGLRERQIEADPRGTPAGLFHNTKEWVAHMMARMTAPARRPVFATLAILAVLGLALALSPVSSLADQLFKTFRVQRFQAVAVRVPGMSELPQPRQLAPDQQQMLMQALAGLGTPTTNATQNSARMVASRAEAKAFFDRYGGGLKAPGQLPAAYAGQTARYGVADPTSSTYVLNVAVAKQYLALANSREVNALPWPQGVDTLTFGYDTPAAVATLYGDETRGFGIVQMANFQGAGVPAGAGPLLKLPAELDVNAFRAAVLALPGLPQDTVGQIRNVSDWERTLIIPVPQDATTRNVAVNGADGDGLLIIDGQGRGSLLLWQAGGQLYAVGGSLSGDEALAVANSLTIIR